MASLHPDALTVWLSEAFRDERRAVQILMLLFHDLCLSWKTLKEAVRPTVHAKQH